MEIEIKSKNQFDEEKMADKVLVDLYATWCGPCKMIAPIVAEVAKEHPEIKVLRVDVDEVEEVAAKYGVSSIPTLLYLEKGELVRTQVGFMPKPSLLRFLGL